MAIFKNIKNLFGSEAPEAPAVTEETDVTPNETPAEPAPKPKMPRLVIDAPMIQGDPAATDGSGIRIKALPSLDNSECRFMVDRPVLAESSWHFPSKETTAGSKLGDAVFAADPDVESVLLHDTTLTITRRDKAARDWKPLAETVGAAIRAHLDSGEAPISDTIRERILEPEALRASIQNVIDNEINPGVSSHGGVISIVDIKDNGITINMGGGCQGCSSAAMTLKGGIERAFRDAEPTLGAILDATDHAAGTNPYFS